MAIVKFQTSHAKQSHNKIGPSKWFMLTIAYFGYSSLMWLRISRPPSQASYTSSTARASIYRPPSQASYTSSTVRASIYRPPSIMQPGYTSSTACASIYRPPSIMQPGYTSSTACASKYRPPSIMQPGYTSSTACARPLLHYSHRVSYSTDQSKLVLTINHGTKEIKR